jgi:phage/plasmid-associated DNA primase
VKLYEDEFLYWKEKLFVYTGVYWKETNSLHSELRNKISGKFVDDLTTIAKDEISKCNFKLLNAENEPVDVDAVKKFTESLNKKLVYIKNLKRTSFKSCVKKEILDLISNDDIVFETKTNYFAFNNKVYNLDTDEWSETLPSDYINITTGYDYAEPSEKDVAFVEKMIRQILTDDDVRKFYMVLMATGLYGITLQKFILALGEGRNGKGCLNDFIKVMMGKYGYELNSAVLLERIKDGVNQEIANMNNKRWVISREPSGYA